MTEFREGVATGGEKDAWVREDQLNRLITVLKADVAMCLAENTRLLERVAELEERCDQHAAAAVQAEEALDMAVDDLNTLRYENEQLRGEVTALEDELASYTEDRL